MRWKFVDSRDAAEREQVLACIDAWWRAFAAQTARLSALFSRREQWDLVGWMNEHLGPIHPQLMWEFGPGVKNPGGHRLVITPERHHHLLPLVEVLLARAPVLPGWECFPWRLPEDSSMALRTVQARTGVDFSGFRARAAANDDGTVDITYTPRSRLARFLPWRRQDEDATQAAAVIATESLVGEELLHTRVRSIQVEGRGEGAPLANLAAEVAQRLREASERLPAQPFHRDTQEDGWSAFKLEPVEQDDYASRYDLLAASTRAPELFAAAHSSMPFTSQRFSRHGETFCYLKLDGAEGFGAGGFPDRTTLEDALNEALVPGGLGCVFGGGTGLRYAYVDLAVMDVERALPVLREVVRRGKVPKRTWLLFFDSTLGAEWVPLWEDTPPPPEIESTEH